MTTFRTDRAPILPPIPQDATPDQQRFFKAVQDLLSENFRSTRQDLEAVDTTIAGVAAAAAIAYKQKKTYNTKYGFWGEVWYKDADEIVIKPANANGLSWVGAVLNDNTYLESSTAITAKLAAPGAGGHIGDGITAVLNSSLYKLWLWNNAGTITPMFTYAPLTTFSNANPTNALTLGQINAQDIGKLFPVGAHVVVWQDGNEFETPYFYSIDAGAATVDVTADKPKVASTTTAVLTLGENLTNATFTAGSTVYQVDGWQPLQIDGTLATGTSGYLDTGIYILTTAAGDIAPFMIIGNAFVYVNGTGVADWGYTDGYETINLATSWTISRLVSIPPDKCGIGMCGFNSTTVALDIYMKPYWCTYGHDSMRTMYGDGRIVREELCIHHGLLALKDVESGAVTPVFATRGYII